MPEKRRGQLLQLSEPETSLDHFDVRGMGIKLGLMWRRQSGSAQPSGMSHLVAS